VARMEPARSSPALSVVVIGRNEGHRLERCLESIQRMQWRGSFEVIYVDSNSTDGSPELARLAGAQVVRLDTGKQTAARGRNAGWRLAATPLVLFLDGDTILDPDFPRHAADAMMADPSVAVVWGHCREIHPSTSIYNRVLDLDWIYPPGITEFCGGNALVRRDALEQVGGYEESLIAGEEPEMCRRIRERGLKILHIDAAMVGHDLAITNFHQYWKRAVRSGYAYADVAARSRGAGEWLWENQTAGNVVRGSALLVLPVASLMIAVAWASIVPLLVALGIASILALRTAHRAKWKCAPWSTRLLYGVHSHFQQIPILAGQLKYHQDRRKGRRRQLIEYKETTR